MNQANLSQTSKPTIREKYKSLPKRILTSSIALSSLAGLWYLDTNIFARPYSLTIVGIIVGAFVAAEFLNMTKAHHLTPFKKTGILFTILLFAAPLLQHLLNTINFSFPVPTMQIATIILSLMTIFWLQGTQPTCEKAFENTLPTITTVIYIGLLGSFLVQIAWLPTQKNILGIHKLFYFILVTKITDIGAFILGVAIGKNKWIPHISPGKSIEGLIGGILSSIGLGLLLNYFVWNIFDSLLITVLFSLLMAYCGQLSDLIESVFKRTVGFKDSGNSLPGFGGIFDLTDSLICTAPIAYTFFLIFSTNNP